jgi:hypothetical protein
MSRQHLLCAVLLAGSMAFAQHDGMDMQQQEMGSAEQNMDHMHAHAGGPHMQMTHLRAANAADAQRGREIAATARAAIEKYKDVSAAEADGFKEFLPQVKHQKMYHYTNWKYAMENAFRFNPEHPTSLLYEDDGQGGKRLIGAMFTAPARLSQDELNERVPLSVAQWHLHTNLCMPVHGAQEEMVRPGARFGLNGSISTKEECDAAGGRFHEHVFGWMVHLYPYEKTPDAMWSVERQMAMK